MTKKRKIGLIGTGNYAWHLSHLLVEAGMEPEVHFGRSKEGFQEFDHLGHSRQTDDLSALREMEVVFMAVSDKSISSVSAEFQDLDLLLIHVSGGKSIEAIKGKRKGVFYIPQTLTKGRRIDLGNITLCLEADQSKDLAWMAELGEKMKLKWLEVDSDKRKHLHLAAVFASNFTNHMYAVAEEYLEEHDIPKDLIHPLIDETSRKALEIGPLNSQTGPAKRNDIPTIKKHIKMLKDVRLRRLYRHISNHIFDHRGKDL